jgi:hypothetical protein
VVGLLGEQLSVVHLGIRDMLGRQVSFYDREGWSCCVRSLKLNYITNNAILTSTAPTILVESRHLYHPQAWYRGISAMPMGFQVMY